jgi:Ca2+-binding RTX toxin-like protein
MTIDQTAPSASPAAHDTSFSLIDNAGAGQGTMRVVALAALGPATTGNGVTFDADRGLSASDRVTNVGQQVVKGTLDAPLANGEFVEVSFDNGTSWIPAGPDGPTGWTLGLQSLAGTGELTVRVTDAGGNSGPVTSYAYTVDTITPSVGVTSTATLLKAGQTATLTFTFSEDPYGVGAGDFVVTGGSIGALNTGADPKVYTTVFTPTAGYSGPAGVTLAASSYTDLAGNPGMGSGTMAITVDSVAPTLAITSSVGALKIGETALVTFTFSEVPVGFGAGSVTVSGGTLGAITATANSTVYTALFTPTQGVNSGNGNISVAGSTYTDTAGNAGTNATMPAITIDTLAPLATAIGSPRFTSDTGVSGTDLLTAVAAQTVSGDLSAPLAGGEVVQVSFNDGGSWQTATINGPGTGWSIGETLTGSGVLRVRVADAAGNHSTETASPYAYDQSPPTVAITSNVPVANGVTPAIISFIFSEVPHGFSAAHLAVSGGVLGALTPTSNALVYTATFTPTAGVASGSASITLSGGYTDAAGNNGGAGSIASLQIDTLAPTTTAGGVSFLHDTGSAPDDLITNDPSQTVSGTLSAPLLAGEVVQVSLNGGTTWNTAAFSGTAWELAGLTLSGNSNLQVRVADAAGNFSTPYSVPYTIDTTAPTVTITSSSTGTVGYGQSTTLTFTLSDPGVLTAADIAVTGGTASGFSGSGSIYTMVVTPPANSTVPITVNVAGQLFADTAGNASTAATPLVVAVNTTPPPPDDTPAPVLTTVDGVPITSTTGPNGATLITVPVVPGIRTDTPGSASALADIPLVKDTNGQSLLLVSIPTGVGLTSEGLPSTVAGAAAQAELVQRIEKLAGAGTELGPQAQAFLATLGTSTPLTVQTITPTTGAGFNPNTPLVITGGAGSQAIVVDARSLPSGTVIQVDNVEFIAVVGAVRVVGGAGQNVATGDGAAQWIVLGPGDDIIHGGGGNDVVGSEAGDDQVFGDAGDDIVFGGGGNDMLSGGAGSDRLNGGTGFDVAIQEGKRTDYTITLEAAGIKLTHIASGVSDWLVDVEQVRFETGPILTVAHSAAEEAGAFLFQKWLGRDLTQGEGAAIQALEGWSAEQVATAFAQLFPAQTAGKSVAQQLEGMGAAGIVRVDAARDVVVNGDAAHNTITPVLGLAKSVDGGAGIDTVVIPATLAQTHIQHNANGSFTLQRMTDGAMLDVVNVERITFNDTQLALDLNGHAGQAAKLLGALGGPALLANKALLGEAIRALDAGVSAQSLASAGLAALGASTHAQVAQVLFTSALGRAATQSELQPLLDLLGQGLGHGDAVVLAGDLDLNAARIDLVGLASKGIEFA